MRFIARGVLFLGALALIAGLVYLRFFAMTLSQYACGIGLLLAGAIAIAVRHYIDQKMPVGLDPKIFAAITQSNNPLNDLDQLEKRMREELDRERKR